MHVNRQIIFFNKKNKCSKKENYVLYITFVAYFNMGNRSKAYLIVMVGVLSALFFTLTDAIQAQELNNNPEPKYNLKSHLYFGGGFGLQFGSVTLIELSPLVGYKVTSKFSVGLSPTYKYYRYKYSSTQSIENNVFGGSIFARYSIYQGLFAHVEYESLFYNTKEPAQPTYMQQFNSFFVGGGYSQPIGQNSGMYIMLLWNLNDTPNSPYVNPVIRVGFNVGL